MVEFITWKPQNSWERKPGRKRRKMLAQDNGGARPKKYKKRKRQMTAPQANVQCETCGTAGSREGTFYCKSCGRPRRFGKPSRYTRTNLFSW